MGGGTLEVDWGSMEGGTGAEGDGSTEETAGCEGGLGSPRCGMGGSWLSDCGWDGEPLDRFCRADDPI